MGKKLNTHCELGDMNKQRMFGSTDEMNKWAEKHEISDVLLIGDLRGGIL
jgi:hypothetical protein